MKKNMGPMLALYPTPVTGIGARNGGKPTWTLAAHTGIIGHDRGLVEFPTYQYLKTGEVIGKCLPFKRTPEK